MGLLDNAYYKNKPPVAAAPPPETPAAPAPAPTPTPSPLTTGAPVGPAGQGQAPPPPPTGAPSPQPSLWSQLTTPKTTGDYIRYLHDVMNPQPASPGPQTWRDWALTKTYPSSPADYGTTFGNALLLNTPTLGTAIGQKAVGASPSGGAPSPAEQTSAYINQARANLGPMAVPVEAMGYDIGASTIGLPALGGLAFRGISKLPETISPAVSGALSAARAKVAPYVPDAIINYLGNAPARAVSGAVQSSLAGGIQGAGQSTSADPMDILERFGAGVWQGGPPGMLSAAAVPGRPSQPALVPKQATVDAEAYLAGATFAGKEVKRAFQEGQNTASGGEPREFDQKNAPQTFKATEDLATGLPQTGRQIVNIRDELRSIAASPKAGPTEQRFATTQADMLDQMLREASPSTTPGWTGQPLPGQTGHAADVIDAAQAITGGGTRPKLFQTQEGRIPPWMKTLGVGAIGMLGGGGGGTAAAHYAMQDPVMSAALGLGGAAVGTAATYGASGVRQAMANASRQRAMQLPYYRMTGELPPDPTLGNALLSVVASQQGR